MTDDKQSKDDDILVGTWFNGDDYETDVEYRISKEDGRYVIQIFDSYDAEEADVYDIQFKDGFLSFAYHWNSNGRLVKCRIQALSKNRIDYTYTYSDQALWHRKGTEPAH